MKFDTKEFQKDLIRFRQNFQTCNVLNITVVLKIIIKYMSLYKLKRKIKPML